MAQIAGIAIERRNAEDALRDSEAKFRGLFDSVMEGVYRTSRDGRFWSSIPPSCKCWATTRPKSFTRCPAETCTGIRRPRCLRAAHGERGRDSQRGIRFAPQGRHDAGRAVQQPRGARQSRSTSGFEGTITDITERKKAETAVFQAKERAQVTLQSIGDAVITTDSTGRIDYMNPVAESLTGWENPRGRQPAHREVLTVVDETTRSPSESPVMRCLARG
jgi:PAS domain-containing protein